ncbi:MAG: hypothetical protein KAI08_09775 [Bacteroidales bacterium]|nr:hypothetical protein [Bacteroidales bacterium]
MNLIRFTAHFFLLSCFLAVVSDLLDDFTYTADIASSIDGKKLGAQEWWGDISDWDSDDQLAKVKAFYSVRLKL